MNKFFKLALLGLLLGSVVSRQVYAAADQGVEEVKRGKIARFKGWLKKKFGKSADQLSDDEIFAQLQEAAESPSPVHTIEHTNPHYRPAETTWVNPNYDEHAAPADRPGF